MNILDFYRQFMGPDDLVFDIGANIGERTTIFAQLARKVVAVEPIATVQAEHLTNVVFEECAVGERGGYGQLFYDPQVMALSSMSPQWIAAVRDTRRFGDREWPHCKRVDICTLDSMITAYGLPAFIKIDVEGYELQVLRGLSQPVKALSFEWHPEFPNRECVDRCEELGMNSFAVSLRETFELSYWGSKSDIQDVLRDYSGNTVYGDVYARV